MTCPSCSKTLRKDNTRGACATCIATGLVKRGLANPGVGRRFRAAVRALGGDPQALITEFQSNWLAERVE